MGSFYIFLPSNSDRENFIGNFTVELPEKIKLNGDWEVSMREFNYTRSWMNIDRADDSMIEIVGFPEKGSYHRIYVPYNDYGSPQELIDAIKFAIEKYANKIKWSSVPKLEFGFDSVLKRCVLKLYEPNMELAVSDKISYMLGFSTRKLTNEMETQGPYKIATGYFLPDMNASIYALMVHCDLVKPQLVGNTYANLLRMVPVTGHLNENITNIYNDEQYVPVLKKEFDAVKININDDSGKIINFQFGRTYITLHFRRVRR